MPSKIAKYYIVILSAVLILAPLLSSRAYAQAPAVQNRYLNISNSALLAAATYTFGFDLPSPTTIGSMVFEFCSESPLPNTPCTSPPGFSATAAVLAQQVGETNFSISTASSVNKIIINRSPSMSVNTSLKYVFNNITNPDTTRTYYARIYIYPGNDATGATTFEAGLAFAINSLVPINAIVPPYLKFCVGQTIPQYDCASAGGQIIDFGELSTTRTKYSQHQLLVATNAAYGYGITINGYTMTSGNNSIATNNNSMPSNVGVSQFGFNLRANSSPSVGQEPVGSTPGNIVAAQYSVPNRYAFNNGDVIAMSSTTTDYYRYTASYIVNVDKQQQPGIYSTTIVYICLANF